MRNQIALLTIALPLAASAQFTDSIGYTYNNPNSALIGTMIQNNVRANMLRSALFSSNAISYGATRRGGRTTTGSPLIYQPRPYPVERWLQEWSGGDPVKRKSSYAEWLRQKPIWEGEVKARGAKRGDLTHTMATAFVLAYEAYTGQRASAAGYAKMVAEFREGFSKDRGLVGASNDRKNEIAEGAILESTDAVMRRRNGSAGQVAKAKEVSSRFLDRWWKEGRADAVAVLSSKGVVTAPKTNAPVTLATALKRTGFRRVSPTVLPEKLSQTMKPDQRELAEKVSRQVLDRVRTTLANNGADEVPVDNVARGVTFALTMLHNVALSTPGQEVGSGVTLPTRPQVVAIRQKLVLNLGANAELGKMTDRQKQELTETLYFLPAFLELVYKAGYAKGDLNAQRAIKEAAKKAFQSCFGVAPESFSFAG